jgi:hypothetical protein
VRVLGVCRVRRKALGSVLGSAVLSDLEYAVLKV